MATTRFRLIFHVPPFAAAKCKSAIFSAGAGRQGNYSECCFTTSGMGQFRPTEGANPAIGKVGALEEVEEVCVETLCVGEETTRKVVAALKEAHPYEEVSYMVQKLEDF
ncbi:structural toxin protein RtxA [Xylaria flabelliformis]|nr:structural toxin protein RtxA [Xylaria flabelliformis]KAI0861936.1 GTP cyclohydrolase 1 type 2/Nif3 [Xylaria cubensis]